MKGRNLHKTNAVQVNEYFNENVNVNDLSDEINFNGLCEVMKTKNKIVNLHTIVGEGSSPRKGACEATCLQNSIQSILKYNHCNLLEMLFSFHSMLYQIFLIFCNKTFSEKKNTLYIKNKILFVIDFYIKKYFIKKSIATI